MATFKDFLNSLRSDGNFLSAVSAYLKSQDCQSDLQRLGIDTQGSILVPVYRDGISTPEGKPKLPDGYLKLSKNGAGWKIEATYKNNEPQVL